MDRSSYGVATVQVAKARYSSVAIPPGLKVNGPARLPVEIVVEIARHADAASRRVLYRSSRLLRGAVMARRWSRMTVNEEGMFALKRMLRARDQLGWTRLGLSLVTSLVFDNLTDAETLGSLMSGGLVNVTHIVFTSLFVHQLRTNHSSAAAKKA